MVVELIKGSRFSLSKEVPNLKRIAVGLGWQVSIPGQTYDIDASVFMLGIDGKVPEEGYFVFYNNLQSPDGSLRHSGDSRTGQQKGNAETISIDLAKVNADIQQIVFVVTIHEANENNQNFSQVKCAFIRLFDQDTGKELSRYWLNETFSKETALEFGRLYRKDGEWRFQAVGQGYNAGLQIFVDKYLVETKQEEKKEEPKVESPVLSQLDSLKERVTLKKNESALVKKSSLITASLEWKGKGDLDLYCFYITTKDEIGKVYYRNLGDLSIYPHIALDGDSKVPGCEAIKIAKPNVLKYVLFAAYSAVSNGIGSFSSYKPKAVVTDNQGHTVVVPMLENNDYSYWVAIALIDFTQPSNVAIKHVEMYSGMKKVLGFIPVGEERSPLLYKDGTFKMDVGAVEFKSS